MPTKVTIYHNPRCSKSRAALEFLQSHEIDLTVIEYLKDSPDHKTVESILAKLGMKAEQIMRRGDRLFKDLGLHKGDPAAAQLIDALVEHPALLERPIVTTDDAAAIGRPLTNVIELIDEL